MGGWMGGWMDGLSGASLARPPTGWPLRVSFLRIKVSTKISGFPYQRSQILGAPGQDFLGRAGQIAALDDDARQYLV